MPVDPATSDRPAPAPAPPLAHGDTVEAHGLRNLLCDGICTQVMVSLTGGAFLVAYALLLGASHKVIGLVAAIGPLSQLLQMPAMLVVEWSRRRKNIVILSTLCGRLLWFGVLALPWLAGTGSRLPMFMILLGAIHAFGAVASPAYNSWKRDFIPEQTMASYLARRMSLATGIAALVSLVAGLAVDRWQRAGYEAMSAYALVFVLGASVGLWGLTFLRRVPEPPMGDQGGTRLLSRLAAPFRIPHQRRLLIFLGCWNLAANFAAPFFTVYMLQRLQLGIALITALGVLSQSVHVLFLRLWGRLADRFSSKSVLAVSGPLFLFSIVAWPFTTLPEPWPLTLPLLIAIHALAGMSTAGVMIGASNITLQAAPRGQATAFIATNALVSGLMATAAPVLGGLTADYFSGRELALTLMWRSAPDGAPAVSVPALDLRGLDFVFVFAFLLGLYAIHRLLAVHEEHEVAERVVLNELLHELRRAVRNVSTVGGLRRLSDLPEWWRRQEGGSTKRPPEPVADPAQASSRGSSPDPRIG